MGAGKSTCGAKSCGRKCDGTGACQFIATTYRLPFILDEAAAAELTRFKSPWLTGEIEWTPKMIKKAVVNMALNLDKPVLSLTNDDYNEYGLSDLLVEKGDAYEINLQVYYMLRDTITGWPGGKPNAIIPAHPERSDSLSKKSNHLLPSPR